MMDLASENGFRVKKDFEKSSNIVTRICAKNGKKNIWNLDFGTGLSTSDLSLALSKKEEEWFFITSTLDGKMLHKLFFYEKCNFWKCYSSTNSRARSSRILKKHSHYTFCLPCLPLIPNIKSYLRKFKLRILIVKLPSIIRHNFPL